jgi:hypothetical protein
MAFSAEGHRAEGQFRRLKSTLNKLKSRKFKFVTRSTTVSTEGQNNILDNDDDDDDDDEIIIIIRILIHAHFIRKVLG